MIWVTVDDVIAIHRLIIHKTGGLDGVRDQNGLESAINAPLQSFNGVDLFPTDVEKNCQAWIRFSF